MDALQTLKDLVNFALYQDREEFSAFKIANAKSIAAQARNNIFMYRVGLSQSIGDVKIAMAINKYIETMCGIFTLIVSGINPIAKDNSEIRDIIKSISAEGIDPRRLSMEQAAILKDVRRLSTEYDTGYGRLPPSPRTGPKALSREGYLNTKYDSMAAAQLEEMLKDKEAEYAASPNPALKNEIDEIRKNLANKEALSSSGHSVDPNFISKLANVQALPTIIKVTFKAQGGDITVPVAIKANPIGIGQEEMRMFMESVLAGRAYNFVRNVKWKSGEISTMEYLFGTDMAERDKRLYRSLGRNPIYIEFLKRKANSKSRGAFKSIMNGKENTIGPTGSIILTADDLVSATKLDIRRFTRDDALINRIMQATFIMCFGIADVPMETVSFYFMGYKEPFRHSFAELGAGGNMDSGKYLEQAMLELARKVA